MEVALEHSLHHCVQNNVGPNQASIQCAPGSLSLQ